MQLVHHLAMVATMQNRILVFHHGGRLLRGIQLWAFVSNSLVSREAGVFAIPTGPCSKEESGMVLHELEFRWPASDDLAMPEVRLPGALSGWPI
jgi:hypothetical protein